MLTNNIVSFEQLNQDDQQTSWPWKVDAFQICLSTQIFRFIAS